MNAIVLVDGENFLHKVREVLASAGGSKATHDLRNIQLQSLMKEVFSGYPDVEIGDINYYAAKLHFHEDFAEKSRQLIADQRALKANLENQGVNFVIAGHVRAQNPGTKGKSVIFKEKGMCGLLSIWSHLLATKNTTLLSFVVLTLIYNQL
jgi:hypothetical protein